MKARLIFILLLALLAFPATVSAQVPDPGSWVDDLTQDIEFMVGGLWYDLRFCCKKWAWFKFPES